MCVGPFEELVDVVQDQEVFEYGHEVGWLVVDQVIHGFHFTVLQMLPIILFVP